MIINDSNLVIPSIYRAVYSQGLVENDQRIGELGGLLAKSERSRKAALRQVSDAKKEIERLKGIAAENEREGLMKQLFVASEIKSKQLELKKVITLEGIHEAARQTKPYKKRYQITYTDLRSGLPKSVYRSTIREVRLEINEYAVTNEYILNIPINRAISDLDFSNTLPSRVKYDKLTRTKKGKNFNPEPFYFIVEKYISSHEKEK